MSKELLDKLKIKPKAEIRPNIDVIIKQPEEKKDIILKTKIKDLTKTNQLDRKAILDNLKDVLDTETLIPKKPIEVKEKTATPIIVENIDIKKPEVTIKIKKKLPKKLKLIIPQETIKTKHERKTIRPGETIITGPLSLLDIQDIKTRLPKKEDKILLKASSYYMNNREIFISFISSLFAPYKEELSKDEGVISCDSSKKGAFNLLTHQKIVRDYINLYTPYRGLLLYHGLGSGKTCSSIAIAEGLKSDKQIVVMTPASLRVNYIEELKKCGDTIYRKNQYWEFIDTNILPDLKETLSLSMSLPLEFIDKQGGAWLVNIKKSPNFDKLSNVEKISLDTQLNEMIRIKYKFINYNGLRSSHLNQLSLDGTINPFSDKVIIIDEAHNFVSRIVNKIKKPDSLSMKLYEYLMSAENCRIVLLTGTPIINYPNEIGILFNILRGRIKTWYLKLSINEGKKVSQDTLINIFKKHSILKNVLDVIKYKPTSTTLEITRNPFGFLNNYSQDSDNYDGVNINDQGNISDDILITELTKVLNLNNITIIPNSIRVETYKALPDTLDSFGDYFIDKSNVKNINLFKRRILGLTSYFPDIDALLPSYEKSKDFHVKHIEMSDFQFAIYEQARVQERKIETNNAKKRKKNQGNDLYEESASTYRIFSRAFCNFVFPKEIIRPLPKDGKDISNIILDDNADEDLLDAYEGQEINDDEKDDEKNIDIKYDERIQESLKELELRKDQFLTPEALETYSPKFLNILENIQDDKHPGLHLIYSQFRTLEGVGILSLVLKANGFAEFKLKKTDKWYIDIKPDDIDKPKFVLYTGTETPEEKEIIRNIFNSNWEFIPISLREQLESISKNNYNGEIVKVIMITASGAEGISLENVRYVHITEPYWHPVRIQQVIGRARRICSHKNLPAILQTVEVFLYLMTFSQDQLTSDRSIELRLKDKSKIDSATPLTSDEALYEISTIKEDINREILIAIKEASIDCAIHTKFGGKEKLQCFTFSGSNPNKFSYNPSIADEEYDVVADINKVKIEWKAKEVKLAGIKYALNEKTGEVYDLDSYKRKNPQLVGILEIVDGKYKFRKIHK